MKKYKRILIYLLAVIIYVISFVIYFNIKSTVNIDILIENNNICANVDKIKNNFALVWEVDAGSIRTDKEDGTIQPENGYYLYSDISDKIIWSCDDFDGLSYTTATVRVYCYSFNGSKKYDLNKIEAIAEVTVSYNENRLIKVDKRRFGNPIREKSDANWQQIISIDHQSSSYITLRFRSGRNWDSGIVWKSNAYPLKRSAFSVSPIYVPINSLGESNETVCYKYDYTGIEKMDYNQKYLQNIIIQAFLKDNPENIAEIEFIYDLQKNILTSKNN